MARRAFVPTQLRDRPFTTAEARQFGLERWNLESSSWRHLGWGVYAWAGLPATPRLVLAGLQLRLPAEAAFSGRTAAWLHGLDLPPLEPVEVTVPDASSLRPARAVSARRARLAAGDVVVRDGLRVTSVPRTLADIAPALPVIEGVVAFDTALRLRAATLTELHEWSALHGGVKGIRAYRRALDRAHPASESPMETRLRVTLLLGGLPRPAVQRELRTSAGELLARVDLYYASHRLGIEYDGATHRESLAEDDRRQNRILGAGYRLLRFTAGDVMGAPEMVVARVRAELRRPQNPQSRANAA